MVLLLFVCLLLSLRYGNKTEIYREDRARR